MPLTLIVFAGFYEEARHAVRYADTLAQALSARLVLLHVNRASIFDPYEMVGEQFRQEELNRQTLVASALYQQAAELATPATVEIATDLLPTVAEELGRRHHPALFILGQAAPGSASAGVEADCAELLRTRQFPVLVVPRTAPSQALPSRLLIAADREPFTLETNSLPLRQMLARLGRHLVVAHVSDTVVDDEGCGAALHAVKASGLVDELPSPELRGYAHKHFEEGLLAAVQDTQSDLVVMLARPRSFLSELFHRSVTARLLATSPVPVLVLPTVAEGEPTSATGHHKAAAR
ncbi:hypothetical protein GCM10027346_38660 [Hymenobacter seoulensis]